MTALQIVGKINIFSASSSFLSLVYCFANYSCFRERWNGTISHSFTDIMVCVCSLFTDMVLRVLVLGYVFYKLNFYAFILPIVYFIIFCIFLICKEGISVMLKKIVDGMLTSFVSPCMSTYISEGADIRKLNLRSPSKLIFNGLSFIILTIAITFSLLPPQNNNKYTAEDCQSLCMYKNETENYNFTMLTACKNLTLPNHVNFIYIGIVCFFWLLSNLELLLETKFSFMPWNKFHVRWSEESMEVMKEWIPGLKKQQDYENPQNSTVVDLSTRQAPLIHFQKIFLKQELPTTEKF